MAKRNFKPVDANASLGSITFIRPAKLAEENKTGIILEGTYVESLPNQFNDQKSDYKFTDEKGNMVVLNGAGNLGFKTLTQEILYKFCTMEKKKSQKEK